MLDFEVEKLRKLEETKKSLIGLTAEDLASKKVNRDFFNTITFLDPEFKVTAIDNIDYDEVMKEVELNKLQSEFVQNLTIQMYQEPRCVHFLIPIWVIVNLF